jgi:hypothetical protein
LILPFYSDLWYKVNEFRRGGIFNFVRDVDGAADAKDLLRRIVRILILLKWDF